MNDQDSLLAAINEDVFLVPYDPGWPSAFSNEQSRLFARFPSQILAIEHIGSTAIPGMSAKPIVDLLAGVESMSVADTLVPLLCEFGYTTSAEFNASLDDRRWFMRWADGRRTHHLHVVVRGGETWRNRLAFRDRMRSDHNAAAEYEALKARLAIEHSGDREAYTAAKGDFVRAFSIRGSAAEEGALPESRRV